MLNSSVCLNIQTGNACPTHMESFNNPVCKTYRGRALVILRPLMKTKAGTITLTAKAEGFEAEEIIIEVQ
ncbi:MAG: hypothetical protein ACERKD_11055 [Prolixibacteraceae bacterium]